VTDLSDSERISLIRKALQFCEQKVTRAAILKQFQHETGRQPTVAFRAEDEEKSVVRESTHRTNTLADIVARAKGGKKK